MRIFGLIGYPLTHSFSKKYFTEKFEKEGLADCRFENFPIATPEKIKEFFPDHPGLSGLSVTIPYKQTVIPFLDEVSDAVRKTGACNCIRFQDRKRIGFNTDITGFERSLKSMMKPHYRLALILGTGGSSAAVEYVLKEWGIEVTKVSRNKTSGCITYKQLTPGLITGTDLIINTTPLGMFPDTEQAPDIPYSALHSGHLLFDLVYNPEKTLFLRKGEEAGARIKNGLDMLMIQAEENWKIWNS